MHGRARWLALPSAVAVVALLWGCWHDEMDPYCGEGGAYCPDGEDPGWWGDGDGDTDVDGDRDSGVVEPGAVDRCVPGRSLVCACSDGASGAQVCLPDGTFAPCECAGGGDGGDGGDGDVDVDVDVDADVDSDVDGDGDADGDDGGTGDPDGGCYWYCP